jgi:hypothetical protein
VSDRAILDGNLKHKALPSCVIARGVFSMK